MFADHILFLCISTLPEETVILHTDFPQPLGRSMILELESHGALKLLCLLLINRRKNVFKNKREREKKRHLKVKLCVVQVLLWEYKPLRV